MQKRVVPSFLVTKTVGADHALTLCSICPSSNILSTNSCWIFIFFGDNFLGLHLIGLVEPVSMSCMTASVRPVIGVPGAGKVWTCLANKVAARARWLDVNSVAASNTSIKCCGSAPSSVCDSVPREPICWIAWSPPRARFLCALVL